MGQARQYALVEFDPDYRQWANSQDKSTLSVRTLDFLACESFYFLGEIPNMPGHCIVVDSATGMVFGGFHADSFVEVTS